MKVILENYLCRRAKFYGYYHNPVLTKYLILLIRTFNKISMELVCVNILNNINAVIGYC